MSSESPGSGPPVHRPAHGFRAVGFSRGKGRELQRHGRQPHLRVEPRDRSKRVCPSHVRNRRGDEDRQKGVEQCHFRESVESYIFKGGK